MSPQNLVEKTNEAANLVDVSLGGVAAAAALNELSQHWEEHMQQGHSQDQLLKDLYECICLLIQTEACIRSGEDIGNFPIPRTIEDALEHHRRADRHRRYKEVAEKWEVPNNIHEPRPQRYALVVYSGTDIHLIFTNNNIEKLEELLTQNPDRWTVVQALDLDTGEEYSVLYQASFKLNRGK